MIDLEAAAERARRCIPAPYHAPGALVEQIAQDLLALIVENKEMRGQIERLIEQFKTDFAWLQSVARGMGVRAGGEEGWAHYNPGAALLPRHGPASSLLDGQAKAFSEDAEAGATRKACNEAIVETQRLTSEIADLRRELAEGGSH